MKMNKNFSAVEKKEFLNKLYELWSIVPEQRFGQLIENFVNGKGIDTSLIQEMNNLIV